MAQISMYPHEVGRDLIPELATHVYGSQLDSFREAVSNAFDECSKQVALAITKDRIVIEDWGSGIKDYDKFRKFGQASKKSRKGEIIGEKGLGKLSLLNLGSTVCFETNNGSIGMKFYMTLAGFSKPEYNKASSFVSHKGTRITITKLANAVDTREVTSHLRKVFSLRLVRGASISINGEPVKPRFTFDPKEMVLFRLSRHNVDVTGNVRFSEDGKGAVDVYIDHVFVTSLEVDTRRKFEGWVNCNGLTPETSRNNIIQNEVYKEFSTRLRHYASKFPLREIAIEEQNLILSRELNTLLKNYLKDMKVNVKSGFNIKLSSRSAELKKSRTVTEAFNQARRPLEKTSSKRLDNTINVRWEYADLGNEKEPIYFVPPNIIYCNTSSDLYRFAVGRNRYYGPIWIRILPYLSRIAVTMSKGSSKLRPEDTEKRFMYICHGKGDPLDPGKPTPKIADSIM